MAESHTIIAPSACASTLQEYGEPFCELIDLAISSCRTRIASLIRVTTSMRSSGVARAQGPSSKALRAAATARSTSARRGVRDATDDLLGVGRDHLDDVGAEGVGQLPADEKLSVFHELGHAWCLLRGFS